MQTLKEVFEREEERQNLKNMALCFLLVLALVAISLGIVQVRTFSHRMPADSRGGPITQGLP